MTAKAEVRKLLEEFRVRDAAAVESFNYGWGSPRGIEDRLLFTEQRLLDLCSVVGICLNKLCDEGVVSTERTEP